MVTPSSWQAPATEPVNSGYPVTLEFLLNPPAVCRKCVDVSKSPSAGQGQGRLTLSNNIVRLKALFQRTLLLFSSGMVFLPGSPGAHEHCH